MNRSRIEQSRHNVVVLAADLLEGIAKAKELRQRYAPPSKPPPVESQGDLLFDFVRLQADYLTRLGELGRAHRDNAFRTLELLYSGIAPERLRQPRAQRFQLAFDERELEREFAVENRSGKPGDSLRIHLTPFRGAAQFEEPCRHQFLRENGTPLEGGALALPVEGKETLKLRLLSPEELPVGHIYAAEVVLELSGKTRTIPVRLDLRDAGPSSTVTL